MNKSLKILPFLLVLLFISINSSAQNGNGKTDGPLWILKDPNVAFYLDSQNIPSTLSIGYVVDVLVSSLEAYNNVVGTTLSLSYGGVIDGACENVYIPFGPPPDDPPDPDRDVFCFSENAPVAVGGTRVTYDGEGVIHERSIVVFNPNANQLNDFAQFKSVVLHELGHVVGMGHVTGDTVTERGFAGGSVECSDGTCQPISNTLQPYDIAQLQAFYPTVPEKHPEYSRYCAKWVVDITTFKDGNQGNYYFEHLMYQGQAYNVNTNLNLGKVRFDVLSASDVTLQPNRDCAGLELVNGEIFLPYIIYQHSILELLLRVGEDADGIYLDIIDGCQLYPKTNESCSIDR